MMYNMWFVVCDKYIIDLIRFVLYNYFNNYLWEKY